MARQSTKRKATAKADNFTQTADIRLVRDLADGWFQQKREQEARIAVTAWLRRTLNELGNMMNTIHRDPVKDAFSEAERKTLVTLFDTLWREMTDTVEELSVPAELTAIRYLPVIAGKP